MSKSSAESQTLEPPPKNEPQTEHHHQAKESHRSAAGSRVLMWTPSCQVAKTGGRRSEKRIKIRRLGQPTTPPPKQVQRTSSAHHKVIINLWFVLIYPEKVHDDEYWMQKCAPVAMNKTERRRRHRKKRNATSPLFVRARSPLWNAVEHTFFYTKFGQCIADVLFLVLFWRMMAAVKKCLLKSVRIDCPQYDFLIAHHSKGNFMCCA